ncbi:DNA-3-methyladenine glycosylase 2 family protein [Oceanobacillus halophilus]|uniref:DNA-3-methyladenine glycosylase II n=2 Tax=Oceanobacillus halophilus TaxID=930130 RepID=A0A494ZZ68_9BACI|nr:DNA-3-methyladenine glycosylase 2 family protein [Oceanobacillus halophilus]
MYDFDYTLYRISFDPLIAVNLNERSVRVPLVLDGEKHIVHLEAVGTTNEPQFIVRSTDINRKMDIIYYIYDLFQWHVDLTKIHNHFKGTNLDELFRQFPATPIVKDFDLYFSLMKIIIHQQLNMKFAFVLSTRFVEKYGEKVDGVWFYPTPEKIANISIDELRKLQFSGRKAEYVIDTSKKIAEGKINLEGFRKKSDKEIFSELIKIRGIGNWTIENWLMFGLGRKDYLPQADIGIQNAVKTYWNMDRKPTMDELTEISREWEPYRSYASLTLWRSIE